MARLKVDNVLQMEPTRADTPLQVLHKNLLKARRREIESLAVVLITTEGLVCTSFSSGHNRFALIGACEALKQDLLSADE